MANKPILCSTGICHMGHGMWYYRLTWFVTVLQVLTDGLVTSKHPYTSELLIFIRLSHLISMSHVSGAQFKRAPYQYETRKQAPQNTNPVLEVPEFIMSRLPSDHGLLFRGEWCDLCARYSTVCTIFLLLHSRTLPLIPSRAASLKSRVSPP